MKSTNEQLQSRGYLTDELEKSFKNPSYDELLVWLTDSLPVKRTLAARRLGITQNPESTEPLCAALEKEKALYSKIEICNALAMLGKEAVPHLIQRLGAIGSNQHKAPSLKKFEKKSYPLPRDIIARILIRIGSDALPMLYETLQSSDTKKISEAIDAVGFICFYNTKEHPEVATLLKNIYLLYTGNVLIRWKLIRAMGAFPELLLFLEQQYKLLESSELKHEAERSISHLSTAYN